MVDHFKALGAAPNLGSRNLNLDKNSASTTSINLPLSITKVFAAPSKGSDDFEMRPLGVFDPPQDGGDFEPMPLGVFDPPQDGGDFELRPLGIFDPPQGFEKPPVSILTPPAEEDKGFYVLGIFNVEGNS